MKKITKEERDTQNRELFNKLSRLPYGSDEYILLRNEIVEFNMPLVYSFLNRNRMHYSTEICDFTDLVQGCSVGLIKAVEKYNVDHESNAKFSSYADFWLLQYFNKTLSESRPIHISEHAYRESFYEDGREPVKDMVTNALRVDSLDAMYEENDYLYDVDIQDLIIHGLRGTENKPEDKYDHKELKQILSGLLSLLKPRQAEMILEYYKYSDTTLQAIGKKYGISGNRVRQVINGGIRKMRVLNGRKALSDWREDLY